jgi:hypothetical protein
MSAEKLRGVRFINTHPSVLRTVARGAGRAIDGSLEAVVEVVTARDRSPERQILMRMAFLSINAAASAAEGTVSTGGRRRDHRRSRAFVTRGGDKRRSTPRCSPSRTASRRPSGLTTPPGKNRQIG